MSYGYMLFRSNGDIPASMDEINPERLQPFDSAQNARDFLSQHCQGIKWDEKWNSGVLENTIGRFEFRCVEENARQGCIGLSTSFRQGITESHQWIANFCRSTGMFAFDEQTMEILG
jgi:hypothetical protein